MGPWRLFNQIQAVWGRAWQGCTLLWTAEVAGSSPTGDRPQVPSPDHRARVPRTQTRLTLPPRPTLPWRGHGEARVSPRAAWPRRRAIFRFNRGYVDLLPRTAFSKTAGQAGRASSAGPPPHLPRLYKLPGRIVPGTMVPAPSKTRPSPLATEFSRAPPQTNTLAAGAAAWGTQGPSRSNSQVGGHCLKWQSPKLCPTQSSSP